MFFPLKVVFAKKIGLVLYDSSMGIHSNKNKKKHILEKNVFFDKCFQKKHFDKVVSGSREFRRKKRKILFYRIFFSLKTLLSRKTFEMFVIKDQWGTKKMMRVIETYNSKQKFMERFSDEKLFSKDRVVSGSTEDRPLKRKILLWRNYFFSMIFVFLKKIWFVRYHSSMQYTELMLWTKIQV